MADDIVPGGVLAWEKPPPVARRLGRSSRSDRNWQLISEQLRARPAEWARIAEGDQARSQLPRIATGRTTNWMPSGAFKATSRTVDGVFKLWAVFDPDGVAPDQPNEEERA